MIEAIVGLVIAVIGSGVAYSSWRAYHGNLQRPRSRPDVTVFNVPENRFPEYRPKPQAARPQFKLRRESLGLGGGAASEGFKPVGLSGSQDPQPMGGVLGTGTPRQRLQPADAREKTGEPPTLGL